MASTNGTKAEVNVGGRPRIIDSPEEFDRLVEEYRVKCEKDKEPMTFTDMALHLGFSCRQALYSYTRYDGFLDSVKKAQALVEAQYERRLHGQNVAGAIFALKNHGWSDRQLVEHTGADGGPMEVTVEELRSAFNSRITGLASRIGTAATHTGSNGNGTPGA